MIKMGLQKRTMPHGGDRNPQAADKQVFLAQGQAAVKDSSIRPEHAAAHHRRSAGMRAKSSNTARRAVVPRLGMVLDVHRHKVRPPCAEDHL